MIPSTLTGHLCVLTVDDDHDTADSFCHLLSMWGHRALAAYDAETALALARRERPQVILLDLGLPHMSGLQLARRLRALPDLQDLLLIAVTGFGTEGDRKESDAAGCQHHLLKPVEPDLLQRLLADHAAHLACAN
jgi:two-component system CheB/CheR fusion protein